MHWAVFRVKRHRLSWAAAETSLLEAGKQECESRRQALSGPLLLNQNTVREPPLSDVYFQHWNSCKSVGGVSFRGGKYCGTQQSIEIRKRSWYQVPNLRGGFLDPNGLVL